MTSTQAQHYWKGDINDLRDHAQAVMTSVATTGDMTARQAARVLHGIMSLIARKWSVDEMQRTCAELVRYAPAWSTAFGAMPGGIDGRVTEQTQLVAVVCRGILPMAGVANLRAALSFWATESDPGVWSELVGA